VLVVDDEPTLRELIADALRDWGFEAQTATDGADALEVLHRWIPDVIVLDLMMPRLDGTGFTELMRLNPRFASLPVLLVTAAYGARVAAERVGARAVLTKPFELEQLVETVMKLSGAPMPLPTMLQAARAHRRADSPPPPANH
jgi:CheY-like chemotaxis protein